MIKKYIDTVQIYNYECFLDENKRVIKAITSDNNVVYPYRYDKTSGGYYKASGYYKANYIRKMLNNDNIIFR